MGICAKELREYVIKPALSHLGEHGATANAAENLLLGTAAQESGLGFHLKVNRGRGLGIYQITPHTHIAIWDKYLIDNPDLASSVRGLASQQEFLTRPHAELATNLSYATAIAWMIYRRAEKPLPAANDLPALAQFWLRHFNHRNAATAADFCSTYKRFISDKPNNLAA